MLKTSVVTPFGVVLAGLLLMPAQAPAPSALVQGKVLFDGAVPAAGRISLAADPRCANLVAEMFAENVKVSDGGLENVIVYVSSAVTGVFTVPDSPVILDQRDCQFTPRVFSIQVGQSLIVTNSDPTAHNVHGHAKLNRAFNFSQPRQGLQTVHVFDTPEVPLPIRDDVHNWKAGFAGVFAHPFHAVSKRGGTYQFKLPAGRYEITAWHETYGTQKQAVEIKPGDNTLDFVFK